MSVAISQFMKKIQISGAAPPLMLATSRHWFQYNIATWYKYLSKPSHVTDDDLVYSKHVDEFTRKQRTKWWFN
jgi:hypothetical protein